MSSKVFLLVWIWTSAHLLGTPDVKGAALYDGLGSHGVQAQLSLYLAGPNRQEVSQDKQSSCEPWSHRSDLLAVGVGGNGFEQ